MKILATILLMTLFLSLTGQAAEFRGAWVASVHNINFPSRPGLSADQQKTEIIRLLDAAKRCRLNALLVQVRPEGDALYASRLEPWSRYLTGAQGKNPGYDPLAFFIEEGRRRSIDIHAWINPYRAAANRSDSRSGQHVSRKLPQYTYRVGSVLMMDPGSSEIQDHIVNVVRDIVTRYHVAGIHFDDYFYPYPTDGGHKQNFPDDATYAAYRQRGGKLSKGDWRRDNVNTLIRRVGETVHSARSGAIFGVSPFGIFQPGIPAGTRAGVDSYNDLYADPLTWMRNGWIDYLAPQLYWQDEGPQSFSLLLKWWRSPQVNPREVPIWPGIAVDRLSSHKWPVKEIARQLKIEETTGPRKRGGVIFWNLQALKNGTKGVDAVVAD